MRTGIFCGTGPFYQHRKALSEMQQKTLVGFFTEDLEALEQEAVCTPEFGNGRMFYYYMKEGTSNASAGVEDIPGKNNRKSGYHQLFLFGEKLPFQS